MLELLPLVKIAEGYREACEDMGVDAEELVKLGQQATTAQMANVMKTGPFNPAKWKAQQRAGATRQRLGPEPTKYPTSRIPTPAAPAAPTWTPAQMAYKQKIQTQARTAPPAPETWSAAVERRRAAIAQAAAKRQAAAAASAQAQTEAEPAAMKAYGAGLRSGAIRAETPVAAAGTPAERAFARKKEQYRKRYVAFQRAGGSAGAPGAQTGSYWVPPTMESASGELERLERLSPSKGVEQRLARQIGLGVKGLAGIPGTILSPWAESFRGLGRGVSEAFEGPERVAARQKAEALAKTEAATAKTDVTEGERKAKLYRETREQYEARKPGMFRREQAIAEGKAVKPVPTDPKEQYAEQKTYNSWLELVRPQMIEADKGNPGNTARRLNMAVPDIWLRHEYAQKHPGGGRGGFRPGPRRRIQALRSATHPNTIRWDYPG